MINLSKIALATAAGLLLGAVPAYAQQAQGSGHEGMSMSQESGAVSGTGTVNALDAEKRTVNLSHEPIAKLGWPAMTMDMKVADDVDLAALEAGETVGFTLERGADGIYVVSEIQSAQ